MTLMSCLYDERGGVSGQMSGKKLSVWLIFPGLDPGSEKVDIQTSE